MGKDDVLTLLADIEVRAQKSARRKDGAYETGLKEHLDSRDELCRRRYELVTGKAPPSSDELEGYSGPAGDDKAGKGLPYFWLNVLLGQDTIAELITPRDRHALEYLEDVRFLRGNAGMLVEMHFAPNPFFEEQVLRRGIYVESDAEGNPTRVREEGTSISWKEGRSLLVKELHQQGAARKSKGKKGKKDKAGKKVAKAAADNDDEEEEAGTLRTRQRVKPCPSFFRFFLPIATTTAGRREAKVHDPTALDEEEEDNEDVGVEDLDEDCEEEVEGLVGGTTDSRAAAKARAAANRKERDGELMELLLKQVVPRAVHLYLSGPMQMRPSAQNEGGQDAEEEEDGYQMIAGSTDAGGVSALPPQAQRVLHALQHVQRKMDELALGFKTAKWEASKAHDAELQQLADERRDALVAKDGEGQVHLTVPNFWLRALKSQDAIVHVVQRRDERLLSRLADVRWRWNWERMASVDHPSREAILELHFLPNADMSNTVLRKRYTFGCSGGSMRKLSLERSEVLDGPEWQEGKDLTVRPPLPGSTKPRNTASFFCLFKRGHLRQAFNLFAEDKQSLAEALSAEEELVNELQGMVAMWPKTLYDEVDMEDELGVDDDGEEDEQDEEGDDEDDGADGSSADRKSAQRRATVAASASGPRLLGIPLPKPNGLMLLLGLVMLSQVFIFFEVMSSWKGTMG